MLWFDKLLTCFSNWCDLNNQSISNWTFHLCFLSSLHYSFYNQSVRPYCKTAKQNKSQNKNFLHNFLHKELFQLFQTFRRAFSGVHTGDILVANSCKHLRAPARPCTERELVSSCRKQVATNQSLKAALSCNEYSKVTSITRARSNQH